MSSFKRTFNSNNFAVQMCHASHACHPLNVLSTLIILQYKYVMQDMHVILTFKRTFKHTFKQTFKRTLKCTLE